MIRTLIPDLPTAEELLPYMRIIDRNRQYTNNGPLVQELERRTGAVAVSSATLGLELAARHVFGKTVRVPAFTFCATATACRRAGLEVILCDVDSLTLALDRIDEDSLPVCPFGAPVMGPLVDAAGAWGNTVSGNRVYSLHATKALPAAEGGLVCGDEDLKQHVSYMRNFCLDDGQCIGIGTNAKMSEYHAAVALAGLERWERTASRRMQMEARYRANLKDIVRMPVRPPGVYAIFPVMVTDAALSARLLDECGIETRRWYTPTLDRHPAFRGLAREGALPVCQRLNRELLCLPFHMHLSDEDIDTVCQALIDAPKRARSFTSLPTSLETKSSLAKEPESMLSSPSQAERESGAAATSRPWPASSEAEGSRWATTRDYRRG